MDSHRFPPDTCLHPNVTMHSRTYRLPQKGSTRENLEFTDFKPKVSESTLSGLRLFFRPQVNWELKIQLNVAKCELYFCTPEELTLNYFLLWLSFCLGMPVRDSHWATYHHPFCPKLTQSAESDLNRSLLYIRAGPKQRHTLNAQKTSQSTFNTAGV